MSVAKQFLRALIDHGKLQDWTGHGDIGPLFKADEIDGAQWFADHVAKYGQFPAVATYKLETGEDLPLAPEPPGYYRDRLRTRHRELEVKRVMGEVQTMAKGKVAWGEAALTLMRDMLLDLNAMEHAAHMLDLRTAENVILSTYATKQAGTDAGLMMGWKTLDDMSGGLRIGDTVSIAGRPGIGKTWAMLYAALHGWMAGHINGEPSSRLFVSMEMDTLMVAQRLVSMITGLPYKNIKGAKLTQGLTGAGMQYEKMKGRLKFISKFDAPFWIVDGNLSSTADEVAELAVQLKPDACFIDAAYLLKHPTERDRYKRVSENADIIKKGIANAVCPVVASWQLSRDAEKKKTKAKKDSKKGGDAAQTSGNEDVGLEDIAYADAIGQVSSLVLGIFESENPEDHGQRRVRVLKGRSGETGHFDMKWNFTTMDFREHTTSSVEDMQIE